MNITIGADPEFFVKKDGKYVSAHELVQGTKEAPFPVPGGAVQVDGMALEFNINPASKRTEFNTNITSVLAHLRKMVPNEYEFAFTPIAPFGKEYLDTIPDEPKKLGCTPDYNAYTGEQNPTPNAELPFRTASGHIHIGWTEGMDPYDEDHFMACRMLTKQLDVFLGLASLLWDDDTTRRELYGKAGAFRPKSYGVEYRVLSNAWLDHDTVRECIFPMAYRATKALLAGKNFAKTLGETSLRDIIDSGSKKHALYYLQQLNIDMPTEMWGVITEVVNTEREKQARDELGRWKKASKAA